MRNELGIVSLLLLFEALFSKLESRPSPGEGGSFQIALMLSRIRIDSDADRVWVQGH